MYFVYILKSFRDKRTYVDYTNNLENRLKMHNSGQVIATRHRRPLKLLFIEELQTLKEAKKREVYWKSGGGRRRLRLFFR